MKLIRLRVFFISISCMVLGLGLLSAQATGATVNLARITGVQVSTSFVSGWESLAAINDGFEPSSSTDRSHSIYGNWNGEGDYGKYNWVEYAWDTPCHIVSASVYWFTDYAGLAKPTVAYIEYWDGMEWVQVSNIGTELNKYNTIYTDINGSKIRLYMKSETSTGIIEFKVMGNRITGCEPDAINTYIIDGTSRTKINYASVKTGENITFNPTVTAPNPSSGRWRWKGPDNFTSTAQTVTLKNLQPHQSGTYTITYVNACGATSSAIYHLTVADNFDGSAYSWPAYTPTINYNFRQEFPDLEMPTENLIDTEGIAYTQNDRWWTFHMGNRPKSVITEMAITPMLQRMNEDFAYIRDVMGWPPDKRVKRGYRSAIYLLGSGMAFDASTDSTQLGGWQGSIYHKGENWPMVYLSYYPVYCFDPSCPYTDKDYQTGGVVHEGIHSVLADLPGCRNAAWFHEGGNTWLQQEMESRRSNNYGSMGFLNAGSYIAPFMPIECYSGWLQDGSFGGPSAEGVNMYDGGQQICTWRNLLGGVQYSNAFPVFLANTLGDGSVPWVWRYCETRVLEGIADTIGNEQIRRLIMEYRAKQAVVDMKNWTNSIKVLLNNSFGTGIGAEWSPYWKNPSTWSATPYVKTVYQNGTLIPEQRTTPGWSGGNQIPLRIDAQADEISLEFIPLGENMSLQLCYRTRQGEIVYSQPVFCGECKLKMDPNKRPSNDVVFAVVSNLNYVYEGEVTRKAHYDYRINIKKGITHLASIDKRWFNWENDIVDQTAIPVSPTAIQNFVVEEMDAKIYPNPLVADTPLKIELKNIPNTPIMVEVSSVNGQCIYKQTIQSGEFTLPNELFSNGMYILTLNNSNHIITKKIIVQ